VAELLGQAPKEEDIIRGKVVVAAGGGTYVDGDPEGLQEANEVTRKRVQELMDATWKGTTTRDRGFAEVKHFEVVQVLQNSNKALYESYCARREQLALHFAKQLEDVKTKTEDFEASLQEPCRSDVNEFFFFHGTNPMGAKTICADGFRVDLSGTNKGALYGPGVYCAESSSKADEYATDDKGDLVYKGLYAMLLCRVSLGNPTINLEVEPDVAELSRLMESEDIHSIVGDREATRGTYREFVLRNPSQVYPAYAIIYKRRDGALPADR